MDKHVAEKTNKDLLQECIQLLEQAESIDLLVGEGYETSVSDQLIEFIADCTNLARELTEAIDKLEK